MLEPTLAFTGPIKERNSFRATTISSTQYRSSSIASGYPKTNDTQPLNHDHMRMMKASEGGSYCILHVIT